MSDRGARYTDKKIAEIDRKLSQTYKIAKIELTRKLKDFKQSFRAKDKAKRQQLEDGKISKQQYKDWLAGQVFQQKQWETKLKQVEQVMLHHDKYAMEMINSGRLDVFKENYYAEAFRASWITQGVDLNIYNTQAIERLIEDDPQLLPEWKIDEEKDYQWNQQKVNNIVQQGIIQGEGVDQITDRLCRDLCSQDENRMRLFARTAYTGAQNAGRQAQMQQAVDMGIEVNKRWIATLDSRTRDTHRALDGEEVPQDEEFSNGLEYPGDPAGDPEEVYNCRCTMQSVYPKYEDRSKKWREGAEIDGQSYEEWKEGKKAASDSEYEKKRAALVEEVITKIEANAFNDQVPEEYRKLIIDSIRNADDKMLELINKTADKVHVDWMENDPDHPTSCYYEGTGSIKLLTHDASDMQRTPEDILRIFWHEYGHFIDDAAISGSGFGYKSEYGDYFFNGIYPEIMKDDRWMFASRDDTNKLLDYAGLLGQYECRFEHGMYSAGIFKGEQWIDARSMDFDTMDKLQNGLTKWVHDFAGSMTGDDYLHTHGYPVRPDRKDYIESYFTPKRNIYRERDRFKGAGEAYNAAVMEYYKKVEEFEKTHDVTKILELWRGVEAEIKRKEDAVSPATDTFDGGVGGDFSAWIRWGGHEPKYYAVNRMGAKEAIANTFSVHMTRDEYQIKAMEELCPNAYRLITEVLYR